MAYRTYGDGTTTATRSYELMRRVPYQDELSFTTVGESRDTALTYNKSAGSSYYHLDYRAYLDYDRSFGKHHVQATAFMYYQNLSIAVQGSDYVGGSNYVLPFNTALSGFEAAYSYDNRYFVKFDLGYSATEQFAPDYRWIATPSVSAAWTLKARIHHIKQLKTIFEECDYITLHLPCTGETRGMINASSIATMKAGVRLLNFARGELVVTEDLLEAVDQKKIACYVTDFPADEMLGHENIVSFPHLGASTPESEDNCAVMAANELMEYLETGNTVNSVNLPNLTLPRSAGMPRVCVIHLNVSGLINKLTAVISDAGCNIENMISGSRKEYAYTIFDLSGKVPENLAGLLDQVPDVIRSRVI